MSSDQPPMTSLPRPLTDAAEAESNEQQTTAERHHWFMYGVRWQHQQDAATIAALRAHLDRERDIWHDLHNDQSGVVATLKAKHAVELERLRADRDEQSAMGAEALNRLFDRNEEIERLRKQAEALAGEVDRLETAIEDIRGGFGDLSGEEYEEQVRKYASDVLDAGGDGVNEKLTAYRAFKGEK